MLVAGKSDDFRTKIRECLIGRMVLDEIEQLCEERDAALDELRENLEDALNGEYREMLKEDIVDELNRE